MLPGREGERDMMLSRFPRVFQMIDVLLDAEKDTLNVNADALNIAVQKTRYVNRLFQRQLAIGPRLKCWRVFANATS